MPSVRLFGTRSRPGCIRLLFTSIAFCGQKCIPAQFAILWAWMFRETDSHISHMLDHPIEIKRSQRVNIHVWSRVHEVDRVRNAVTNGPLKGVHIVSQCAHELQRVLNNTFSEFRAQMFVFNMIFTRARVVFDRKNFFLSKADAADILLPLDKFLYNGRTKTKTIIVM